MITLILSGRATPARPRAEALRHLKSVHGPMVYDAPAHAGTMPSVYVQNHVLADLTLPPPLEAWRWDRDLVTEISFEDIDHLKASTRTPYYLDTLKPDEARFVDHASVRPLVVTKPVVEGDAEEAYFKLFVYLRAADPVAFAVAWPKARASVADRCAAQSASAPVSAPGAPPAFVDGVWSLWFDSHAEAEAFALTRLEPALAAFGDALSPEPGFIVLAEEFPVTRLRRENAPVLEAAR